MDGWIEEGKFFLIDYGKGMDGSMNGIGWDLRIKKISFHKLVVERREELITMNEEADANQC